MTQFWLCFVPLFIAVDAVGVLPIFLSLTEGIEHQRMPAIILQSLVTASLVALGFLWIGPALLRSLGITVADFMIAGGILLFTISLGELLSGEKGQRQADPETVGAVPLGVPLITGPAVLTTCVLLANQYGRALTGISVVINIALAGVVFRFAAPISRWLGASGTKTVSKIARLLLASIAVMLIRKGVLNVIAAAR